MWEDQRRGSVYKGTSGGLAISISACDDNQTSADTNVSAFTHSLTHSNHFPVCDLFCLFSG